MWEEPVSNTFWMDFSIAEKFGYPAITDTYRRAFNEWKSDYKMVTALVMVLNHKIWYFWEAGNEQLSRLYNDLWEMADKWCVENLKGDELKYFYEVTD